MLEILAFEDKAISSISLLEAVYANKRGSFRLPISIEDFLEGATQPEKISVLPITSEIAITMEALEWDHKDPADRTIVATSCVHRLPLYTSDDTILKYAGVDSIRVNKGRGLR